MKVYRIFDIDSDTIAYTSCKDEAESFCLINNTRYEKISETLAISDPNYNELQLLQMGDSLIPAKYYNTAIEIIASVIRPMQIAEGVLMSCKNSIITREEKHSINIVMDILNRDRKEVIKTLVKYIDYKSLKPIYDIEKELDEGFGYCINND